MGSLLCGRARKKPVKKSKNHMPPQPLPWANVSEIKKQQLLAPVTCAIVAAAESLVNLKGWPCLGRGVKMQIPGPYPRAAKFCSLWVDLGVCILRGFFRAYKFKAQWYRPLEGMGKRIRIFL